MSQYKSHLRENLKSLRESKGLTQEELASAARRYWPDISRSIIAVIESRDRPVANTDVMKAIALAKVFGVSVEDLVLLDRINPMLSLGEEGPTYQAKQPKKKVIPFYKTVNNGQGNGSYAQIKDSEIICFEVSDRFIGELPAHSGLENLKIIIGNGFSMEPMFGHGDMLVVDAGVQSVQGDGVYFFRIGEHYYIKILEIAPMGIRAISKNQDYSTWMISKDTDFEVLARVLRVWEGKDPV